MFAPVDTNIVQDHYEDRNQSQPECNVEIDALANGLLIKVNRVNNRIRTVNNIVTKGKITTH